MSRLLDLAMASSGINFNRRASTRKMFSRRVEHPERVLLDQPDQLPFSRTSPMFYDLMTGKVEMELEKIYFMIQFVG
jgi:hypothetical protein